MTLSVVVPVYNVAPYLEACLQSISAQTLRDLDVVVVDDGSTDGSDAIAAAFVERDPRFRLVRQPNGGLGNARNNGMTQTRGELLAFVDSDDLLPPRAYELLVGALEQSGSDFATGAFRRLDEAGSRPAYYAAAAFAERRRGEHIRRFHPLAVDRTAWNKVFRRPFWDRHRFRFGEGVHYEDQYATLPAYFLARTVEVLPATVYYWRLRAGSITDDRSSATALGDRITAVAWTRQWLLDNGFAGDVGWYDASVVAQDLSYAPEVIARMSDGAERSRLLDQLLALVGRYDEAVFDRRPAVDRLGWHLLRRRDLDRLRAAVDAGTPGRDGPAPVRRGRHWYADHPLRSDRRLPRRLFRIDDEIGAWSELTRLSVDNGRLVVEGAARLTHLHDSEPDEQSVRVATCAGEHRIELAVTGNGPGYVATLDLDLLRTDGRWQDGDWRLEVEVGRRSLCRVAETHRAAASTPLPGVVVPLGARRQLRVELTAAGALVVHVERRSPRLTDAHVDEGDLVLRGQLVRPRPAPLVLRLSGAVGKRQERPADPAAEDGTEFVGRLPLATAASDLDLPTAPQSLRRQAMEQWELSLVAGSGHRLPLVLDDGVARGPWRSGDREWLLDVARSGFALLVERAR